MASEANASNEIDDGSEDKPKAADTNAAVAEEIDEEYSKKEKQPA